MEYIAARRLISQPECAIIPLGISAKGGCVMSKFLNTAIAAIGSLASFAPSGANAIKYPHANECDALRLDWMRIGRDMKNVIGRENDKIAKARSGARTGS